MVLNSSVVVTVARVSSEAWQRLACTEEPLSGEQLLDLLCRFPFHQLGRLALCFCSFFCLPPSYSFYYISSDSDSDSDSASDSGSDSGSDSSTLHLEHDVYYHSHSD